MTPSEAGSSSTVAPRHSWRVLAALAGALVVALIVVLILVSRSSGASPPATGAATVIPGGALAYFHVSTDPTRPAVRRAETLLSRFPSAGTEPALLTRLGAILGGGRPVSIDQVRPWLGKEAALALLETPSNTAGSLIVLDVKNHARASAFLVGAGAIPAGTYERTELLQYRTGTELAFVKHYLVLGQDASVRAAVDVASGRSQSLAATAAYQRAASGEPSDRVLDAYASLAGVRGLLAARGGAFGLLGALLNQPALAGTTVSVSPLSGGARIRIHSALDPNLARLNGSSAAKFTPTLQSTIPSSSTMLFDVSGLSRAAPRILSAGAVAGLGTKVAPLLSRLGAALAAEGINVQSIVSIFGGETAVAITQYGNAPSLVILARTHHSSSTRDALAGLEAPLAQLFPAPSSGPGQTPVFNDVSVAGVTAHQLALAPGLQISYAVFNGLVVVSTSIDGIAAVASHERPLADDHNFKATLGDRPVKVTSLVFLDFSQLLSLGEQTGLLRSARLRALQPDLDRIRAIGLASTSGETDSTAELYLKIS